MPLPILVGIVARVAIGAAAKVIAKRTAAAAAKKAAKPVVPKAAPKPAAPIAAPKPAPKGGGKGPGNTAGKHKAKKAKKPKPKCGKSGPYKDRKDHDNEGMNWDHVPSQKALLERAVRENRGRPLSQSQIGAIVENAPTIAIPKGLHTKSSETFGGRQHQSVDGIRRPTRDSSDLQRATKENTDVILEDIDKHDPGCKGAYRAAARKLATRTDAEWAAWLKKITRDSK